MITLATIPARHHAALAAARVDVVRRDESWTLLSVEPGRDRVVYVSVGTDMRRIIEEPAAGLTLPATDHNVRALAVVLAEACGLDVRGGVTADVMVTNTSRAALTLRDAFGCAWTFGETHEAMTTINPHDPDALFRALVSALCALETA